MHFLIFVPEHPGPAERALRDVGLDDLIADAEGLRVVDGPTGQPGYLVGWRTGINAGMPLQVHEQQHWRSAVPAEGLPAGRYQVGWWRDAPPVEEDLRRRFGFEGLSVELGNGQSWTLPVIWDLPTEPRLDEFGTWRVGVAEYDREFYEAAQVWRDFWVNASAGDEYDLGELVAFVVTALRRNYRLVPEIADQLGLLRPLEVAQLALFAVIGGQEAVEAFHDGRAA